MNFSVQLLRRAAVTGTAALFVVGVCLDSPTQAARFIGLGVLPGGIYESRGLSVSADGTVVVGESSNAANVREALRWTEAGGMAGLGIPPTAVSSAAFGASADGSTIVGSSGSGLPAEAFRWTTATGIVGLGYLNNNFQVSSASGVSADGSVVVGASRIGSGIGFFIPMEAFRWTEATGMAGLGFLPAHGSSGAAAVSADGTVVVGSSRPATFSVIDSGEAFRWTQDTGMIGLGQLGGVYVASGASGVSADGAVIVGTANNNLPGVDSILFQAFRWTEATGMVGLGHLPGDNGSAAFDASADGSIVVGDSLIGFISQRAFIWDAAHGMRDLQDVLINDFGLGGSLTGWQLFSAAAISDDGGVIVGTGLNPLGEREAWVVIIPEPLSIQLAICAGLAAVGLLLNRMPRRAKRAASRAVLFSPLLAAFIVCHASAHSHAATLRTLHFEGLITASASSQVAIGDRFVGQITYDIDAIDDDADPDDGFYYWELPLPQPIGWHYAVGNFSHTTEIFSDLWINQSQFFGDTLFFSSDAVFGPSVHPPYGSLYLEDGTGTALSSDRPAATLDLAAFSLRLFDGSDGTRDGAFSGELDVLRVIPEPATLALLVPTLPLVWRRRRSRHAKSPVAQHTRNWIPYESKIN